MHRSVRTLLRLTLVCLGLPASLFLTGCGSTGSSGTPSQRPAASAAAPAAAPEDMVDILRPNDLVGINFTGVASAPGRHEERIKEDGTITLPLNLSIKAAGRTAGQLQHDIYNLYVPKYYREQLTVTVSIENRFFFVDGEVKIPNRYVYSGQTTVLKCIAASGGFTDFANKKKVRLNRANGEKLIIDCVEAISNQGLDKVVYPGDQIVVPRRYF